jgi:hypothetical protein
MTHDLVQIGAQFQSGNIFRSVLPLWAESIPIEQADAKLAADLKQDRLRRNILHKRCR